MMIKVIAVNYGETLFDSLGNSLAIKQINGKYQRLQSANHCFISVSDIYFNKGTYQFS